VNFEQARNYLFSLRNQGSSYGIDRMALFVEALQRPDKAYPIIHIAGTNGKGSTAAMLESIYRSASYKTGLFTSPHLVHLTERIQVNRRLIREADIPALTVELEAIAKTISKSDPDLHPTFFEFITAMAFLHFQQELVDIAIVETGLGGRLDASNVITPEVSVITSIGLDHINILGDTIEKIAAEKAGIIKPGIPVVLGRITPKARQVLETIAAERQAPVHRVEDRFGESIENYPHTNLHGTFQRWNAATAQLAVEVLQQRFPVSTEQLDQGLQQIEWAGRWQKIALPCGRTLILDATHNPEGAQFLDENLAQLVEENGSKPWIITGTLGDFRAQFLMPISARHARGLYLVEPQQPRTTPTKVLRQFIPADFEGSITDSDKHRLFPHKNTCTVGKPGDTIVVTGSIYLLGEILECLRGPDPSALSFQDLI